MGHWRFKRSIGSKFLKLNISKTGFSITGGVPGAHINADLSGRRKRPFMGTLGIPGTGLSYRTNQFGVPVRDTTGERSGTDIFLIVLGLAILAYLLFGA
jgi:hypothetical protein